MVAQEDYLFLHCWKISIMKLLLTHAESVKCNTNFPCTDQSSPLLMKSAIWTWDENEPSQNGTICVAQYPNGRWRATNCTNVKHFDINNKFQEDNL